MCMKIHDRKRVVCLAECDISYKSLIIFLIWELTLSLLNDGRCYLRITLQNLIKSASCIFCSQRFGDHFIKPSL